MNIADRLLQAADDEDDALQERSLEFKNELAALEARKAQIEATIARANLSHERRGNFEPMRNGKYQCPLCWVRSSRRAALKSISASLEHPEPDCFGCAACGHEFAVAG